MKVKIYYHHTDCGGVVYYANYLDFLEEARTELLAQKGVSTVSLAKEGILFVVSRQEIDYKYPAFYGDTVIINTEIANISRVRVEFLYKIENQDGRILGEAKTVLACVGDGLKVRVIPDEIRERMAK
ncbi:MAG: thioesterase family protein [Candidatus Omnitrophota bacterium]